MQSTSGTNLSPVTHATVSGARTALASSPTSRDPSGTEGLALITEPQDGIAPILRALAAARHQIDMVIYEDEDQQIDDVLAADKRRGVNVRVLLDDGFYGEGSSENAAAYSYLRAHGVAVRWSETSFALTHQKTLIIDARAYILTFNLTPSYYPSSRDFGVIDAIPADVNAIERTFNADYSHQPTTPPRGVDLLWSPGSQTALVALISSATGWVDIENEEMDSTAIEQALETDARRGVNVRVTMTADTAWRAAFTRLAGAGVHIRLYDADAPLYIHAKMILTHAAAFLGSQNFSTASMDKNRELGIITTNATIRASLAATFAADDAAAAPFTTPPGTGTSGCPVSASYSGCGLLTSVEAMRQAVDHKQTCEDALGARPSRHQGRRDGPANVNIARRQSARLGQRARILIGPPMS